jgi:uncharacterized protein
LTSKTSFISRFRLFLALLALLVLHASVQAQEELPRACEGRNLFEDLKTKDPAAFAKVIAEMQATPNHGPLFWRIEGKGGVAPSWLLGTAHVTDRRVTTVNAAIAEKLAKSKVVILELREIADKKRMQEDMMSLHSNYILMPNGQSMWDYIPDDQESLIRYHPNVAGMPPEMLGMYQPWFATQLMGVPMCEILRQPYKEALDERLAGLAKEAGVPVTGLERMDEQLAVMSDTPIEKQAEYLLEMAKLKLPVEDLFQTLVEMYLKRQVSGYMPLMRQLAETRGAIDSPETEAFMEKLVDKRNALMALRAKPWIDKGNAFIAVGALHLAGEKGVIELLRKAGYTLTPAE